MPAKIYTVAVESAISTPHVTVNAAQLRAMIPFIIPGTYCGLYLRNSYAVSAVHALTRRGLVVPTALQPLLQVESFVNPVRPLDRPTIYSPGPCRCGGRWDNAHHYSPEWLTETIQEQRNRRAFAFDHDCVRT